MAETTTARRAGRVRVGQVPDALKSRASESLINEICIVRSMIHLSCYIARRTTSHRSGVISSHFWLFSLYRLSVYNYHKNNNKNEKLSKFTIGAVYHLSFWDELGGTKKSCTGIVRIFSHSLKKILQISGGLFRRAVHNYLNPFRDTAAPPQPYRNISTDWLVWQKKIKR